MLKIPLSSGWWTHVSASALLISAPIGVYYFLSLTVCLSVCLSRCSFKPIILLICFSIESSHFWPSYSSMWHSTKRCSSIFDLGPLTPKIYSPKLLAITLHYDVATRGRALGSSALPGEVGNPLNFGADPCCHGNEIWARCGDLVAYRVV